MRDGSRTHAPDGRIVDRFDDENVRLQDAWTRQLIEKYRRLAIYPWLAAGPDPPPPALLAHPRDAFELPEKNYREVDVQGDWYDNRPRPPAWTCLWTWPWRDP